MLFLNKCDLLEKKLNSGIQWVAFLIIEPAVLLLFLPLLFSLMILASFPFRVINSN